MEKLRNRKTLAEMGEYVAIRSLKPGQKDVNVVFIVLDINRPTKTKEGHEVRTVKVADRSASINLSMSVNIRPDSSVLRGQSPEENRRL